MTMKIDDLDPKFKRLLAVYPVRNPVKWINEGDCIVLIYPKNFTKVESWLHKRIGGPDVIRRPLDEVGGKIWVMCDGKYTLKDICDELHEQYHEDIEPVLDRVWKFLEILLSQNLIRLSTKRVYTRKKRKISKKNTND